MTCASTELIRKNPLLCYLVDILLQDFNSIYYLKYPANNCYIRPHHMFNENHAVVIKTSYLIFNFILIKVI
ncbi:hypothetical protein DFH28DRAFT_17529 [Melampsora americana]|nr:hypothetical protein DFH28DRAFT_17529 [Melampsora americana]